MKAPCQNCPDRYPGCHDLCVKYKDYREELEEYRKKQRLDSEFAYVKKNNVIQTKENIRKHKNRRS